MTRTQLLIDICNLAGSGVTPIDAGDGWPGIVRIQLPDGKFTNVAMHVSTVSPMARANHEIRFQNPGAKTPISDLLAPPILVGLGYESDRPILVALDGRSRVNRDTRFSVLFNVKVMADALKTGWGKYESNKGERIYAFMPTLLPVYVDLLGKGLDLDFSDNANKSVQSAISASGVVEGDTVLASERARRAVSILIREYAFGGSVVAAYGRLCSMCGLNTGLVIGAHIMPVEAPGSPDQIWNGLALCHNHHAAFDLHKIWVDPRSRRVSYHPEVVQQASSQPALRSFVKGTFGELALPLEGNNRPKEEMFRARYKFYAGSYEWALSGNDLGKPLVFRPQ